MTATTNSSSELPDGDELVAYLDGELPPADCRRIEDRLAVDAEYRRQLEGLDRAWDALDELPRTTTGEDFVRTTIDMVTLAAERDLAAQTAALPVLRRNRTLLVVAACVAAAAVGFAATSAVAPDPDNQLLADLPTIVEVDLLTQAGSVEYLRGLAEMPLGASPEDQPSLDAELLQWQSAAAPERENRRQWVEQLSSDEKAALAGQWKRFENLSPAPEAQQKLRELEQQIAQAPDAAKLQRTLLAYGEWLAQRTPGEQAELRELPTDERLRRVRQYARQDQRQTTRRLSTADAEALRKAVLSIAETRRQALVEQMRERGQQFPERRWENRRPAAALFILFRLLKDDDTRDSTSQQLAAVLSPASQRFLESLPKDERAWQLWRWARDSLQPKLGPEELERFFAEDLDNNQREWLLSLPREEMNAKLEQLYLGAGAQLGMRGMEELRGFDARRFGRDGRGHHPPPHGPGGPPQEPGRRGPPPRDGFGRDPFDQGPGEPGRAWDDRGPPGRRPPPPPDGEFPPDWQPPPDDGPPPQ